MAKKEKISKASILIAEPFMMDSNFRRSVIGIVDHTKEDGTVGFILNKKMNLSVNELIQDIESEEEFKVYYGGPVATDTIHYIHNVGDILDESIKVSRGVYWGGDFEKLKFLINSGLIRSNNIRFYLGYSGWSAGQLQEELQSGSWFMSKIDPNYIFKTSASQLWKQTLDNKGDRYSVIAQIPRQISLN